MLKRFPAAVGFAALIALPAAASACGSWDVRGTHEGMDAMHGGGAPQTPVVSAASDVTVEIQDFDFFPRELTIQAGATITWVNRDGAPHDATDEGGGWGTGTLNQGDRATLTFDSPGTYRYLCTIHPNMRASLTVE